MKPRQLNLFADKKHYREMNARFQKEPLCEAFIPRQLELQLLMNTNECKISNPNERRPMGCCFP